jgi:monovalent cation:proton antiporter-2 (CPA2) family protein
MLVTLVALLAAATIAVPLTRRSGLGSVLGYLIAGLVIGPSGLRLVTDVEQITNVSSLGVVMLLFLIGLELRPRRLWIMRRSVFGLGSAQVAITALCLAGLAVLAGVPVSGAAVLGLGMALSSTAIVLPMLGERELLTTPAGRDAFAVLLFQDLAFIPLVALVPLLAAGHTVTGALPWLEVGKGIAAIVLILGGGRFLMRPLFKAIGGASSPELFITAALLIVVGSALLAQAAGLSPSLGAFLAGMMLSDSEYRHELQADIAPFENTLLGFFFISVGMSADLHAAAVGSRGDDRRAAGGEDRDRLRVGAVDAPRPAQRDPLQFSPATSQRIQFRTAWCRGCGRGLVTGTRGACDVDLGHVNVGDPDFVCAVGAVSDPSFAARARARFRYDRTIGCSGDRRRFRPHGADRRAGAAHARDRVHRIGKGPGSGRCGSPLWQQGLLRRRGTSGRAARGGGRPREAADRRAGRR